MSEQDISEPQLDEATPEEGPMQTTGEWANHEDGDPHVSDVDMYLKVFGALFVLTIITWAVAFIDLGFLSTPVALAIAVLKASLVIAFFMHLKDAAKINWVVGMAAIFMVLVLLSIIMSDYSTRDWIPYPDSWM